MSIMRDCFAVRPVTEADLKGSGKLKKVLTAWSLTAIGLGATIGTGVFVLNLMDEWGINFLPKVLTNAPLQAVNDHIKTTGAFFNLPAAAIVAAMSVICYVGMRETAGVNTAMVSLKVLIIVVFIVAGIG